ncbi:MAG TPA: M23 family metallopeptidase [Novosphingobium sp.]|nr:M23 family metallopeptidase [Novosphingobium sp.]
MRRALALAAALAVLAAPPLLAKDEESDLLTETVHVVKPGETLGGIAVRAEVPRVLIIEANGLKPPYLIKAGQKLTIPRRRRHTVKEGETTFSIAMEEGVPWKAIAAANGIDPKAEPKTGQVLAIPTIAAASAAPVAPASEAAPTAAPTASETPLPDTKAPRLVWPLKGAVRRGFAPRSERNWHDGIDITARKGEAVRAAAAGKVIFAGQGPKEYGLTVIVYHQGRWTTTYSFLDKITVKNGDQVKQGERIGLAGETGLAKGPELHFEVRRNRQALDPADYLPAQTR